MYKLETSPLTISGVFKDGWKLYKSSVWYVLVWSLVVAIIHVVPSLFRFVGFLHRESTGHLIFSWSALLLFLILLLVEAFFLIIFFYTIYSLAREQKVDLPQGLKVAQRQMINLYLALIVYFMIATVGMYLFIVPAIFLGVLFSMILPFIVIERLGVYDTYDRSAKLVWGHWWQTFFILIVPYSIAYFARSTLQYFPWQGEWEFLIDIIILTFVTPYFYSVLIVQYNNLKVIRALPKPISQRPRSHHGHDESPNVPS